jgi:hypothetical protein
MGCGVMGHFRNVIMGRSACSLVIESRFGLRGPSPLGLYIIPQQTGTNQFFEFHEWSQCLSFSSVYLMPPSIRLPRLLLTG